MKYENSKNNFEDEVNKIYERVDRLRNQGKMAQVEPQVGCLVNIYDSLNKEQQELNHAYVMTVFRSLK